MALITITFEVNDRAEMFDGLITTHNSLHEALCKAIHEGDEDALDWLMDNVEDVSY